jgi:hypothetical protein
MKLRRIAPGNGEYGLHVRVRRLLAALVLAIVTTLPWRSAHAWGAEGHKIICAIAIHLLNGEQRQEVQRLVGLYRPAKGQPFRYFTSACVFADTARAKSREYTKAKESGDLARAQALKAWAWFAGFDDWHFLNLPRAAQKPSPGDCHDNCVLKAIDAHRGRMADGALKDWQRAEAMILLGHWVGDVHQPLHVSFADDRGGNRIDEIEGGYYASGNLHAVWDSGIITAARGTSDWWTYAQGLLQIAPSDRQAWEQSTPLDWAGESYAIAIDSKTQYCKRNAGACVSKGDERTLGAAYQARFRPVVETRLRQAGVRLAKLIAEAID